MQSPEFKINFKYRTVLYFLFGVICASLDLIIFNSLIRFLSPIIANPIGYTFGSFSSFLLNKNFTFKSNNTKLSLRRYFFILFIGLISSQATIFLGINLLKFYDYLILVKFISMIISAIIQYLGNTFFSNVKK